MYERGLVSIHCVTDANRDAQPAASRSPATTALTPPPAAVPRDQKHPPTLRPLRVLAVLVTLQAHLILLTVGDTWNQT